ncbi:MAG TPA: DUF4139 domain-containing protein [Dyella sp.]|nr:DUF4139 domain-containing protein [Dyella sp.]
MRKTSLALFLLTLATGVGAAEHSEITIYRSDDASLFANDGNSVPAGYAMVREPRSVNLSTGVQDVTLGGLPLYLDPESLSLEFGGAKAAVISQRLRLAQGSSALLGDLVGRKVDVLGEQGSLIASGTLLSAGESLQVREGEVTLLVHDYVAVRTSGNVDGGARLDLRVDATRAGATTAQLSYVTGGLGWRASYIGTLASGSGCQLNVESRASVANRSGSDWHNAKLTLIAGDPRLDKPVAAAPMMAMSFRGKAADLPQQSTLADYRSYRLPAPVDLPEGSISLLPLYAPQSIACERTALYETGGSYQPPQPMTQPSIIADGPTNVVGTLAFRAFDSLPAGYLRVLARDDHGAAQVIGESRIEDTPKDGEVKLTLGNVFDLRARRERTAFHVDRNGRTMDEAFRLVFTNAGDSARTVTVREHPSRWRTWKLASSSLKPTVTTADTLGFAVKVPAHGSATLDYAVRYTWTADDQPQ